MFRKGKRLQTAEDRIEEIRSRCAILDIKLETLREENRRLRERASSMSNRIGLLLQYFGLDLVHVDAHWKLDKKGGPENPNHEC